MKTTVALHTIYEEQTPITAQLASDAEKTVQGFLVVCAMYNFLECSHINIQLYADEDCCDVYFNETVMVPCQDLPDYRMIRLAITVMDALIARLEIGWPDSLPELVQRAMKAIEKAQAAA